MAYPIPPPPNLTGYTVERMIAQGGMARVYLARQDVLQRQVAIKVLDPQLAATESIEHFTVSVERFLREGTLIAALNQPNIVHIYDVGAYADGLPYLIMEYLPGGTLRNRMQGALPADEALAICRQIAQGLAVAHAQGIIHRDVKPSNILFRADGIAVLTDFGIAKQHGSQEITRGGSTLGTPYYLSPEQALGQPVDGRSDLYGLGVMLYEMLTGNKPFEGESTIATVLHHIQTPPPPLPPELAAYQPLLNRLLAKQPEQRYPNANALIVAIDQVIATVASATPPASHWVKTAVPLVLGLLILGAIILGTTYLLRHRTAPASVPAIHTEAASVIAPLVMKTAPPDLALQTIRDAAPTEPMATAPEADSADLWALLQAPPPDTATQLLAAVFADVIHSLGTAADPSVPTATPLPASAPTALETLLTAGQTALAQGRLLSPEQASAHSYFNQALKLDARNATARKGLSQLGDAIFIKAEQSVKQGNLREAKRWVREGLKIQPKHGKLRALQTLLQTQGEAL